MTRDVEKQIPLEYSLPLTLFFLIISGLGTWVSIAIVQTVFRLDIETNLLACIRALLTFEFLIIAFPASIAGELVYSRWKKREFRVMNVLILSTIVGEGIFVMAAVSYALELAFPGLYFTNEPITGLTGLVLGLVAGLPVLVVGLTSRVSELRQYVKKAFA